MAFTLRHIVLLLSLSWATLCIAQDPYVIPISEAEGLPSKDVYDLFQDSRGFIWVASNAGLSRFDGQNFVTYTSKAQSSRSGANIFEDPFGRIWFENFDGHYYYVQDDSLHAFEGVTSHGWNRAVATDQVLLVPQQVGINIYDVKTLAFQKNILPHVSGGISVFNCEGQPMIAVGDVLYTFDDKGNFDSLNLSNGVGGNAISELGRWKGRTFLLSNGNPSGGLSILEGNVVKPFSWIPSLKFFQKCEWEAGKIWICPSKGVWVVDAETGKLYASQPLFQDKSISAILVDRDNNHWFGTLGQGILLVPDLDSRLISTGGVPVSRLATDGIHLFAGDQDGNVMQLEGVQLNPIYRFDNNHSVDFLSYDEASRELMMAAPDLVTLRDTGREEQKNVGAIKQVVRVNENYQLLASSNNTLLLRRPVSDAVATDPWDSLWSHSDTTFSPLCRAIIFGRCRSVSRNLHTGDVYAGTGAGLFHVTPRGASPILWEGQPMFVLSLAAWDKVVYALTTQGELFEMDADQKLRKISNLPVQGPYIRLFITGGKMYLFGERNCAQLNLTGRDPQLEYVLPGLDSRSVNDILQYKDKLALATGSGLLLLDSHQKRNPSVPKFVVTGIYISGRRFNVGESPTVSFRENDVQLDYSVLSFSTGGQFPVWYSINDGEWESARARDRSLRLARLAPGGYQIRFCLGKPDSEVAAVVTFTIRKPWWLQPWFFLGMALVLALVIMLLVRWRWRSIRSQHLRRMERMELENDMRQSRLSAIRSQMNPHFFFNALNTLQALIYTEDKKRASNYLGKFSRLTRMVLEMSDRDRISLTEEIQALTLYLEIEQARFEEDFHFTLHTTPSLGTDDIFIPSMIIQPFVENAVKHGLLHKKGRKELLIAFQVEGEMLVITVEDNGIGRKRSAELNQIRKDKPRSFSSTATSRRVELLNIDHQKNSVQYHDKMTPEGEPTGTLVVITLHMLKPKTA